MVIAVAPLIAAAIVGGAGGGIANVALAPVSSGASLLNSYWYGAGLILGERDMYTFHWEKIKKRLENGEDYLSVLESEMNPAITAISAYSLKIMKETGELYKKAGVEFMINLIEDLLNPFFSGTRDDTETTTESGLLTYTSTQIAQLSDQQLAKDFVSVTNSPHLWVTHVVDLIKQEYNKRQQEVDAPLDEDTPPPDFEAPQEDIFPNLPPEEQIPLITRENLLIHSHGRAIQLGIQDGDPTSHVQSNPQRNGVWSRGIAYVDMVSAKAAAREHWPSSDGYNEYGDKVIGARNEVYWIPASSVTLKNFPHPT